MGTHKNGFSTFAGYTLAIIISFAIFHGPRGCTRLHTKPHYQAMTLGAK